MIQDLNIFCRVTRTVTIVDRQGVVVDADGERFMAALSAPDRAKADDGSPRDNQAYTLRWRAGMMGPISVPAAGWRLSLTRPTSQRTYENLIYEVVNVPREIRLGAMTIGMMADVMPLRDLYPYTADLKEQNGSLVEADVMVALWSEREDHRETGTYEEFGGECPVEYSGEVKANRKFTLGSDTYRITSSITDFEGPRVKFNARRSNA